MTATTRISRLFAAVSITALVSLSAACAHDQVRFADASLADRDLAIATATGLPIEVGLTQMLIAELMAGFGSDCIVRTFDGPDAVYEGVPCDEGRVFDGRMVVYDYEAFWDEDVAGLVRIEFDDFVLVGDEGGELRTSGVLAGDERGADVALEVDADGDVYSMYVASICSEEGDCTIAAGSHASTPSLGAFDVGGTYRAGTGVLRLTGADELVVDFDAKVGDCAPVTIDGVPVADYCDEDDDEAASEGIALERARTLGARVGLGAARLMR